jgi:hypothetical protein
MKVPTIAALLILMVGCSRPSSPTPVAKDKGAVPKAEAEKAFFEPAQERQPAEEFVSQEDPAGGAPKGQDKVPAKAARKIKHSADIKLITDEFDKTRDDLQRLIDKHQGYEAMADVRSSPGTQRLGTWRVRVPIERFGAFREAVRKLAEVESDTVNTEDLTDQYYDLEANIKNLRAEQESWREMLKKTSDKLDNLITVKRELDRVTDEIQRKEGRLRLMANLTELTSVSIMLRERQKFTPEKGPEVVEAATFGMRAEKTFGESWGALRDFGQGVALLAIALAPWLPVILLVGVPLGYLLRRFYRAIPSPSAPSAPPAGA